MRPIALCCSGEIQAHPWRSEARGSLAIPVIDELERGYFGNRVNSIGIRETRNCRSWSWTTVSPSGNLDA
jgi:hypothetical protein